MSNKAAYKKSRKVILKLLNDSFPTPVDIDIFYIEGENPPSDRKLKNYNDVMHSWDKGYSYNDNPIQNELYVYRETLRVLVDEGLVSHESEDQKNRRLYVRCKLTPKGQSSNLASGSELLGRAVDLCCTYFIQQYIGSHINVNARETMLE